MRKKWLYFFIVFVTLVVVLYLWRYKQSQVFENRVPANATKVININLRQIENHLLFDFLANPITYLKPHKRKDSIKKPRLSLTKGISIPRNILFYSNADELKNNWFSSIVAINDKEDFFSFVLKEKFVKSIENETVFFTKDNFVLGVKDEQLIIGLKIDKKLNINQLLTSLFDVKDFLSEDTTVFKQLINSSSDIYYSSSNDFLQVNFNKGIFELQGNLNSDLFVVATNSVSDKSGVIALTVKINKNNKVFNQFLEDKKDKFNEITHLSLDSIVHKWNGKFNMNITSIEQRTDTIISYEYDDDFNKVEIKSTQEKKTPTLVLVLGQEKTSSLSDYFYGKNAIQVVDSDTIFTTIPVFKVLASNVEGDFKLRVNKYTNTVSPKTIPSKLSFYFNAEKYMKNPLDIPLNRDQEKLLKLVKTTNIEWTEKNIFSLKIALKNTNRNFMGQLIMQ